MIEFDKILDKVGHLGRYQMALCLAVYWLGIPAGLQAIAPVFFAAQVPFRCNVPPLDNSSLYPNLTESDILNYTTPFDGKNFITCKRHAYNLSSCEPSSTSCVNTSAPSIACDQGYYFDTREFTSTVNTEWLLVCDRKILSTIAMSVFFAGMWTGAIVFGNLADYIGRRNTMLVSSIGCLVSGLGTAFAPSFELFVVLRFFSAAFSHGAFLIMFVYIVEISGKKRTLTGVHTHTAFAMGYSLNSIVSYFLRDWRTFYFVISLAPIPYFILHWFIPDSPRWHFSNARNKKGRKLAENFAKYNHKTLTEKDWTNAELDKTDEELSGRTYTSFDLFRSRRMRLITFKCMFNWLVISMVYYGLSLNAGSLAGNIFVNNALNGLVELIGIFFVQFTMDRIGRKYLLVFMMILQGVACLLSTIFTTVANNNQNLITAGVVFAFIGKIGVGGSFAIIFNYTAELYPTVIRGNAVGVGSMAARIGSISSPYIILLQDYVTWLPTSVFGVLSIVAGLTALTFPETMNRTMPQTIKEAELFYKGVYKENLNHNELLPVKNSDVSFNDEICKSEATQILPEQNC